MKKLFSLLTILLVVSAAIAQQQRLSVSAELQNLAVPVSPALDNPVLPLQTYRGPSSADALSENIIGATRYDMQTNASCQNRFYLYADGAMGGIWTYGMNDGNGYQDRGTGYNYYNGSTWGAVPVIRIEGLRTGWPSYAPWNGNGEIVVSHHFATFPALMLTRAVKGTGAWDIEGEILPQMTAADYIGFSADDYAWMSPRGDTIAFILGGHWTDTFIMASYDNGTSWEKIPILNNGNKLVPSGDETDVFACSDGSVALEMDNNSVFHVVFGRMRAKGDLDGRKYYPGTASLTICCLYLRYINEIITPFFYTFKAYNN